MNSTYKMRQSETQINDNKITLKWQRKSIKKHLKLIKPLKMYTGKCQYVNQ